MLVFFVDTTPGGYSPWGKNNSRKHTLTHTRTHTTRIHVTMHEVYKHQYKVLDVT